jgi:hypothetical protein
MTPFSGCWKTPCAAKRTDADRRARQHAVSIKPTTEEEIETEIRAARVKRRATQAKPPHGTQ